MKAPATRNPKGIIKGKPIALRLTADELAAADAAAIVTGCTKSALARNAFLIGLPLVCPPSTGLCGGAAKADPAVFSAKA